MRERVFAPLGMTRTFFRPSEVEADGDFAWGKSSYDPSGVIAPDTYENPWARPAGYAFSSVRDLADFARFLLQGQDDVLGSAQRQAMMSPRVWRERHSWVTDSTAATWSIPRRALDSRREASCSGSSR